MKQSILYFLMVFVLLACDGDDDNAPDISKDYLNVAPNMELLGGGDTKELTITANCSWTIIKNSDWLTVNPMAGNNSQSVLVTAGKNTTGVDRVAVLTIKGGTLPAKNVTITQQKSSDSPAPITLSASTSSLTFENSGGTQTFTITSNTSWSISASSWCTVSPSSGKDNASISVTVTENSQTEERTGQIVINGDGANSVTIDISQKAKEKNNDKEPGRNDNLPPD